MCFQDICNLFQIGWTCQKNPVIEEIWTYLAGFKLVIQNVSTTGTDNMYFVTTEGRLSA